MSYLHVIENLTKKRMSPMRPPTEKEAFKGQLGAAIEQVEVKMDENGLDKYLQAADDLLERYSAQDLAALLLKTIAKDPSDLVPVKITPERPLPQGKKSFNKNGRRSNNSGKARGNYSKDGARKNNRRSNDKKRGFVIRNNQD